MHSVIYSNRWLVSVITSCAILVTWFYLWWWDVDGGGKS